MKYDRQRDLLSDEEIIGLYFARDEQAIVETDMKYGKVCTGIAMNILGNHADAEECVSDTWLKTWESIPPKRPPVLQAFLCRIVRNLSLNKCRDNRRARRNQALWEELEGCLALPEEAAGELSGLLTDFLVHLDVTDRRLFMGRYWHACAVKDLAAAYGMTANAVSLRLYKTREKLRAYLTERGYEV
ncbi:MAG: sigma-70 family RNA polymerase sigma factor [Clostridia bacterium]|nr:sigma-70 family RNA polymerase sigma factor [Clostridia bacterium]